MGKKYTADDFAKAIVGSGGIISTVAARVGCGWITAKTYIDKNKSLKELYDAELETVLDVAESVVMGNIQAAQKQQKASNFTRQVDSNDAKWLLSKKGKRRGYGNDDEAAPEGAGNGEVVIYIPSNGR